MLRPGEVAKVMPRASDDPAQAARITQIALQEGKLRLSVPPDQPVGTYLGFLLDAAGTPLGMITLKVLAP